MRYFSTERTIRILLAALCCAGLAACVPAAPGDEKSAKAKALNWQPPNVDAPLRSLMSIPPCDAEKVLAEVGGHATEMTANLENFTAEEKIEYVQLNYTGKPEESDSSVFEYVFGFEQQGGGRSSREYRSPAKGGHSFAASNQDTGLAALALIFLPGLQTDYDMNCEGLDKWNGQLAWVMRFQQRKEKPRRTLLFHTDAGTVGAMLKGRAWISAESGQVLHLETNLMQDIPAMNLRFSAISVDYAPAQIESKRLELWLPKRVEAYWEISTHRIILYHSFSEFKVFSVDTEQNIQKPKEQ